MFCPGLLICPNLEIPENFACLILKDGFWVVLIPFGIIAKFIFLHNNHCCLVLYSFCNSLLHSLIFGLIVSFLSSHNLHLLFCCVLINFRIYIVCSLGEFCASITKDLGSLLKFPFVSQVRVFLCGISSSCYLKYRCSYFSTHFCFLAILVLLMISLLVLFLVAFISFLLLDIYCLRVVILLHSRYL